MSTFVKGACLPRVYDDGLPKFRTLIHYVYPKNCYKYYLRSDRIVVDNEVAICTKFITSNIKPGLYDANVEYFLFARSINLGIRRQVKEGRATPLTRREADQMHRYLLSIGMICVLPALRYGSLFEILIEQTKLIAREKTVEDYVRAALPCRKDRNVNICPSFLHEKEEPSLAEQLVHADSLLSLGSRKLERRDRKELPSVDLLRAKVSESKKRPRSSSDRYVTPEGKRPRRHQ